MCLLAAMLGVWSHGSDVNILTQIGFVVLVGLAAKNAILIVEFASAGSKRTGHDRFEAAIEAAALRLRPILMTSFAFILACCRCSSRQGAGSEMRAVARHRRVLWHAGRHLVRPACSPRCFTW